MLWLKFWKTKEYLRYFFYLISLVSIFIWFWLNQSYALETYKECTINNAWYQSRFACDNNYYLYYNLKGIKESVLYIVKNTPNKISLLKDKIVNVLTSLDNKNLFNFDNICLYFFTLKNCSLDNIKNLTEEEFLNNINLKWTLSTEIIKKDFWSNKDKLEKQFNELQNALTNFRTAYADFIESLKVYITYQKGFTIKNVLLWTNQIEYRILALTNPEEIPNLKNKNINHYKIGLLKIFKPFIYLWNDYFVNIGFNRYIANPYFIFWIIWFEVIRIIILLIIVFLIFSIFIYPTVRDKSTNRLKRHVIWTILINSSTFNLADYFKTILLTNNNYPYKTDNWREFEIINEYRVPILFNMILKKDKVGISLMIFIWILLYILISWLSWYLL